MTTDAFTDPGRMPGGRITRGAGPDCRDDSRNGARRRPTVKRFLSPGSPDVSESHGVERCYAGIVAKRS